MRPDQTPRAADLPTVRTAVRAYFDYIDGDGADVRVLARVDVDLPHDPGDILQPVARCRVPSPEELADMAYLGFDGATYLAAASLQVLKDHGLLGSRLLRAYEILDGGTRDAEPGEDPIDLSRCALIHPAETAVAELPHHRVSGRMRTHGQARLLHGNIEDLAGSIDIAPLRPMIDEVKAAAAGLLLVRGDAIHVRTPLPVWTFKYRDEAPAPCLTIPEGGNVNRNSTAFAHDRLQAALAYADLASVKGSRTPGPARGSIEVDAGWEPTDDLAMVAHAVGSTWLRDLDPIVADLTASGVRDWHLAADVGRTLEADGRIGAEAVLSAVLRLRTEIATSPALSAYLFWNDKTRTLADRLVHIEGMTPSNDLCTRPGLR